MRVTSLLCATCSSEGKLWKKRVLVVKKKENFWEFHYLECWSATMKTTSVLRESYNKFRFEELWLLCASLTSNIKSGKWKIHFKDMQDYSFVVCKHTVTLFSRLAAFSSLAGLLVISSLQFSCCSLLFLNRHQNNTKVQTQFHSVRIHMTALITVPYELCGKET